MRLPLTTLARVVLLSILVFGSPQLVKSSVLVNQIAGEGTIQVYADQTIAGITGAILDGAVSSTIFNHVGVGPFFTFVPNVLIDPTENPITGGVQYDVSLQFPTENKQIFDLSGNLIASFALQDLYAVVLTASPSTITFYATEQLVSQSGVDWDFSNFSNPGSTFTASYTSSPFKNVNIRDLLAGTALDAGGNLLFNDVGPYQFEQIAGSATPEAASIIIWAVLALAFGALAYRSQCRQVLATR